MKKFLIKSILFISVSVAAVVLAFYLIILNVQTKGSFRLPEDTKYVFMGHSHTECTFNDTIIDNSVNLSLSGESYFYLFTKIKKVLEENNQIKAVFIEFSNSQITKIMNTWIWDDLHISERLPIYLPFLNREDIVLLYKNNPKGFISASSKAFRVNLFKVIRSDYDLSDEIGEYQRLEGSKVDSLIQAMNSKETIENYTIDYSTENINYLRKIIEYLGSRNIDFYLIRSPQHKYYTDLKNESVFLKLKDSLFKNVEFLDFNEFPMADKEFRDFGHLNYLGAKKFSKWFDDLLKKGLLSHNNKEKFVNFNMKLTEN